MTVLYHATNFYNKSFLLVNIRQALLAEVVNSSVANLAFFSRSWACFSVELRVFLKTCGLLVFGLVLIEICLFFAEFCYTDCFISQIIWHFCRFNLLLKAYWACFCENLLILGLFFRICHPDFMFDFLADFSFCWIFLPTLFGLVFQLNYLFLACFSNVLACFCEITWHHYLTPKPNCNARDSSGNAGQKGVLRSCCKLALCPRGSTITNAVSRLANSTWWRADR